VSKSDITNKKTHPSRPFGFDWG